MSKTNGAGLAAAETVSEIRETPSAGGPTETSKPTTPKWRDVLLVHPAAELFPLMTREELIALANDIKENGFRPDQRLIFTKFGDRLCLVDGRNRLDALEYLGYEIFDENKKPRPLGWVMTDDDDGILKYVISANLHRRHLTTEQRRELIAKVLKAKPAASNREIAARVKADDKTVAKVRTELEATAEIPQLKKTKGKDGKERPARKSPAPVPSPASPKAEQKVFDSPQEGTCDEIECD